MATKKISELTAITSAATDDYFVILDTSDTTSGLDGTTKKIEVSDLGFADQSLNTTSDVTFDELTVTTGLSAELPAQNNEISGVKIVTFNGEYDNGNSGTTATINWNNGQKQKITLTGDCTLSFTNPSGITNLQLRVIQDATAGRDLTLPSSATVLGTAPTFTDGAASKSMILTFFYDGTTYWYQGTAWEQ